MTDSSFGKTYKSTFSKAPNYSTSMYVSIRARFTCLDKDNFSSYYEVRAAVPAVIFVSDPC